MKKRESLEKLKSYVEQVDFKGYDPSDGLNSSLFKFLGFNKFSFFRLAWIQLFKRLPINSRSFVGIEKAYNPNIISLEKAQEYRSSDLNNKFIIICFNKNYKS